jgi:cobalt-zinc-cadmium efflux system outer membrane protein
MAWLAVAGLGVGALAAQPPAPTELPPPVLTLDAALAWSLQHNPELMALRQQHGVAAAGVVIAQTYPFNPFLEAKIREASGPFSATITNVLSQEYKVLIDIECRGQRRFRLQAAAATLSRTDWEIANQELIFGVRLTRAFDTVLYRDRKRQLLQTTIELNQKAAVQVEDLVKTGRLRTADLILIRTEVEDSRAAFRLGQSSLVIAYTDLRRALGVVDEPFQLQGQLEPASLPANADEEVQLAMDRRPDLHARQAAIAEAEARLGLEVANRYGLINAGPAFEYDPTRISLIGLQVTTPIPVFNTHEGEIMTRRAERARAGLDLRLTEVAIQQDVRAALARLEVSHALVATYRQGIVPDLEKSLNDIRQLFENRDPGVDLLRVIDVQRKLLRARDAELDALYEARQATADLAAAVGDPLLALAGSAAPP